MDKYSASAIGVALPALLLAMVWAGSGSLYQVTPIAPRPAEPTVEADAAEALDARAEEETATAEAPMDEPVETAAETEAAASADETAAAPEPEPELVEPETGVTDEVAALADTPETPAEDAATATAEPPQDDVPAPADPGTEAAIDLAALRSAGDERAGARVWRQCSACHVADQEQNRVGPHLVGIFGRPIASIAGFNYSDALMALDGVWTPEEMSAWLADPRAYAPGNRMTYRGLDDEEDRADLLAYLAAIELGD